MIVKLRLSSRIRLGGGCDVEKEVNVESFDELDAEVKAFATEHGLDTNRIFIRGGLNVYRK